MAAPRVLVVDDDISVGSSLGKVFQAYGYETTVAESVPEALKRIVVEEYDVLLSDLHMPGAGDGLTVVGAMRHSHPKAITVIFTSFPEMDCAAQAIVRQADMILVKPTPPSTLVSLIGQRLASGPPKPRIVESLAEIIHRTAPAIIEDWFQTVQLEATLTVVPLSREDRCGHLPELLRDLEFCLSSCRKLGNKDPLSFDATEHGRIRRAQGYTPAMIVEESRILQVNIFRTLQNNLETIDFRVLLLGVMSIADEVDYQLSQAMSGFDLLAERVA